VVAAIDGAIEIVLTFGFLPARSPILAVCELTMRRAPDLEGLFDVDQLAPLFVGELDNFHAKCGENSDCPVVRNFQILPDNHRFAKSKRGATFQVQSNG
jgi:hypothetical protein